MPRMTKEQAMEALGLGKYRTKEPTSDTYLALDDRFTKEFEEIEQLEMIKAEILLNPTLAVKGLNQIIEKIKAEVLKKGLCPECGKEFSERKIFSGSSLEPPQYGKSCSCGWRE